MFRILGVEFLTITTAIRLTSPISAIVPVSNSMGPYPNLSETLPDIAGAIDDPHIAPKATMEDIKPKFTLPINSAVMMGLTIDISPCGPP